MGNAITPRGAVLITGASRGLGFAAATRLAVAGYHVYAGVRNEAAAQRLTDASAHITAVRLDVRDEAQIDAALSLIADRHPDQLRGLINNAAGFSMCPMELLEPDHLRTIIEINLIAPIRLIQKTLPQLRASGDARIINMGSVESRLPTAVAGTYATCKAGLRAMADCLRLELRPWDIKVVTIEPGVVQTDAISTTRQLMIDSGRAVPPGLGVYDELLNPSWIDRWTKLARPMSQTVDLIEKVMADPRPRGHYYVGPDAHGAGIARWLLPERRLEGLIAQGMPKPFRRRGSALSR
jgi:NAD(P)-dependent dehydrogenase (short-subunit alcohol dehydrogenase family)